MRAPARSSAPFSLDGAIGAGGASLKAVYRSRCSPASLRVHSPTPALHSPSPAPWWTMQRMMKPLLWLALLAVATAPAAATARSLAQAPNSAAARFKDREVRLEGWR